MTLPTHGFYLAIPGGSGPFRARSGPRRTSRAGGFRTSAVALEPRMRQPLVRTLLALAAALSAACAAAGTAPAGRGGDPLVSSLQVATFADSVSFALRVTNAGSAPVELEFPSGQTHDFVVSRGGAELWRWSADRAFTQALVSETLAPGETRAFEGSWRVPAGTSGELVARGFLTAGGRRAEQQAAFRLP